ncbi:hypothetical protein Ddc_15787 [Ditylenchus destructor]|nr:hypothetical protein Ddc_15787 [Ditylenchus destructor]
MNFQCCQCSTKNISTSFRSLDELQDHLFTNHLPGTSSPNAEPFQTLTANQSAIANESINDFLKRIITTVESKGQQSEFTQHCSTGSATSAQSNVKTEPEGVNTFERKFLGKVETGKRKASSKSAEHFSYRNNKNEEILGSVEVRKQKSAPVHNQQKVSSKSVEHVSRRSEGKARQNAKVEGESSCLRQMKQDKKNMMSDKPKPGPSQVDLKRIQGDMTTDLIVVFDNCDSAAKCIQQRKHKIQGRDFIVWAESPTKSMKKKMRANV